MEESSNATATEAVRETLKTRGWCFGDTDQLEGLIMIHSALADDINDSRSVADSIESELLNTDLRSIGAKSLPDPNPSPKSSSPSHLLGPKILQISSVRDISASSIENFAKNSGNKRLLRLSLTDGHTEVIAIEYSHIPSIPDDVIPGTKVRLENKISIRSGIVCLHPKAVTVLGGVVQSLYEEWQMNQKYLAFSRSSLRPKQDSDTGGPPPFEKFQVGPPSRRLAEQGGSSSYLESTCENSRPAAVETAGKKPIRRQQAVDSKEDSAINDPKTASHEKEDEEKPSSSDVRQKEEAEAVPVQNRAAAQKLLQKMSHVNWDNKQSRGRKHRGKGKQEEQQVLTLDEWEKQKAGVKPSMKNELPNTSKDEDFAWQLQNQLNLEDTYLQRGTHNTRAEDIRMSMFNYERDDHGMEHGGRGTFG